MELHKRRRTLTEPEVRYWMTQIVAATEFMHKKNVIHRDLKLGNLFIDRQMQIKVGDFGLATTVEFDGERKKTLCGTPNYIAPEILDRKGGHSFPVDVWSIGCILYTLLVGRPPFETSNIESTYRKIRSNDWAIPSHVTVSESARDLIKWCLAGTPERRPTIDEMMAHPFMQGFTPSSLPRSALSRAPTFEKEFDDSAVPSRSSTTRKPLGVVDTNSPMHPVGAKSSAVTKKVTAPRSMTSATSAGSTARAAARASLQTMGDTLNSVLKRQRACAQFAGLPATAAEETIADGIWITKWVDYSNKYGLGYQLSSGAVGVLFNDATKMILAPDQHSIQSIDRDTNGAQMTTLTLTEHPTELNKKVTLLKYFKSYMKEHLLGGGKDSENVTKTSVELPHVKKWTRTKHAIVFRLSNSVMQINFFDHSKLVVNIPLGFTTYIDKDRVSRSFFLEDIAKWNSSDEIFGELTSSLTYCSEVIEHMMNPSK